MTTETIEIFSDGVVVIEVPVNETIQVVEEPLIVFLDQGTQGPPGPPGDLIPQGPWSALTQYTAFSMVEYLGSSYRATSIPPLGNVPTDLAYWELLVSKGDQGIQGVQGEQGIQGIQGVQGNVGPQGTQGVQGVQGDQGIQGIQGPQGDQGVQGIQGPTGDPFQISKVYASVAALVADTAPTGISAGQFAIIDSGNVNDPDNSKVYLWNGSVYSYIMDMSGADGIQGAQGIQGVQGIQGAQGIQGDQGVAGSTGSAGADGKTLLNGSGAPGAGLGVDGDFYMDTVANAIYGPKTAGAWGSATPLVGPQGDPGPTGPGVTIDEVIAYAIIFGD